MCVVCVYIVTALLLLEDNTHSRLYPTVSDCIHSLFFLSIAIYSFYLCANKKIQPPITSSGFSMEQAQQAEHQQQPGNPTT